MTDLAEAVRTAVIQDFARATAGKIRDELVCCDVYQRLHGTSQDAGGHDICFWGEASAQLVEAEAGLRGPCACERRS